MDISINSKVKDQISKRCLRCYKEQYWYGENFLLDYIEELNVRGRRILEIGCAEAGLLKFYKEKGALCSGLELSNDRFSNAKILNQDKSLHLFQADICKPDSYSDEIRHKVDIIILRDVIEHITDQRLAMKNIHDIMKPGGKLFMSFPPKFCPYAGHQQTSQRIIGKLPYLHLLPDVIYKYYLQLAGVNDKKIEYLIRTKKTRISIREMKDILDQIGFLTLKESNWFFRPAYSFRFGLPKVRNPFSIVPYLNELLCNGITFLLIKKEN